MDDEFESIIGNNRIEDVRWLCSLSDSELDLLINLKCLAIQRAEIIGHVALAEKFDLKMLRGISFVMMENLKDRLGGVSSSLGSLGGSTFLSGCNLLRCDPDENFGNMGIDELMVYVCNVRKRKLKEVFKGMSRHKKQKREGG